MNFSENSHPKVQLCLSLLSEYLEKSMSIKVYRILLTQFPHELTKAEYEKWIEKNKPIQNIKQQGKNLYRVAFFY